PAGDLLYELKVLAPTEMTDNERKLMQEFAESRRQRAVPDPRAELTRESPAIGAGTVPPAAPAQRQHGAIAARRRPSYSRSSATCASRMNSRAQSLLLAKVARALERAGLERRPATAAGASGPAVILL